MPDGKRKRRFSAQPAQKKWYAFWRHVRFNRRFGVGNNATELNANLTFRQLMDKACTPV